MNFKNFKFDRYAVLVVAKRWGIIWAGIGAAILANGVWVYREELLAVINNFVSTAILALLAVTLAPLVFVWLLEKLLGSHGRGDYPMDQHHYYH